MKGYLLDLEEDDDDEDLELDRLLLLVTASSSCTSSSFFITGDSDRTLGELPSDLERRRRPPEPDLDLITINDCII